MKNDETVHSSFRTVFLCARPLASCSRKQAARFCFPTPSATECERSPQHPSACFSPCFCHSIVSIFAPSSLLLLTRSHTQRHAGRMLRPVRGKSSTLLRLLWSAFFALLTSLLVSPLSFLPFLACFHIPLPKDFLLHLGRLVEPIQESRRSFFFFFLSSLFPL